MEAVRELLDARGDLVEEHLLLAAICGGRRAKMKDPEGDVEVGRGRGGTHSIRLVSSGPAGRACVKSAWATWVLAGGVECGGGGRGYTAIRQRVGGTVPHLA